MDSQDEHNLVRTPTERAIDIAAPAMPTLPFERAWGIGLIYGERFTLSYTRGHGNDVFIVTKGTSLRKVVDQFPLTGDGWGQAFVAFARLEPEEARNAIMKFRNEAGGDIMRRQIASASAYLPECLYLGGHGLPLSAGQNYDLMFNDHGTDLLQDFVAITQLPYDVIQELEISGRGQVTTGGGFIGGGFGFEGAATGIAIAAILNAATMRTQMETVLRIQAVEAEGFFHYWRATPERLRIELSAVFGRVRRRDEPSTDAGGIAGQLSKLAELHREGSLSTEEFEVAKRKLLQS